MKIALIPSRKYLLNECIPEEKIFVTGNTIVDVAYQNLEISKSEVDILKELGLNEKEYFVATVGPPCRKHGQQRTPRQNPFQFFADIHRIRLPDHLSSPP